MEKFSFLPALPLIFILILSVSFSGNNLAFSCKISCLGATVASNATTTNQSALNTPTAKNISSTGFAESNQLIKTNSSKSPTTISTINYKSTLQPSNTSALPQPSNTSALPNLANAT